MKKFLLYLILLVSPGLSWGQLDNTPLYNRIRPQDTLSKSLHFNLYNFNYVRNYEYSNKFHDGYTLYGTQLEPQIVYYAHPSLAIKLGASLRKDFGSEGLHDAKPVFALVYNKNKHTLIFGALEGDIQHGYIEPIFNFENKIVRPIEYGTQFIVEKENFRIDTWISWQKMIYRASNEKEEIVGGAVAEMTLANKGYWKLSLPVQFLAYHQGGQIDLQKDKPLSTLVNGAGGLKLTRQIGRNVSSVFTENYLTLYKDFSPTKARAYQSGFGLWLNLGVQTKWGRLVSSYWKGDKFMSIKGMPLYQSVSMTLYDEGFKQDKRDILIFQYSFQKQLIPKLYLDIRFEPHFDFGQSSKNLQFNHSLFFTYKEDFKLFKF